MVAHLVVVDVEGAEDLGGDTVLVRAERQHTDVGGDRLPKGQRVHSVPIAPQVYELLLRLAPDERDPDARVFPGEKSGAMDASALYRRYVKA